MTNESNTTRKDLIVRDVMSPQHRIDVLETGDVATARVGDIVSTLQRMGRQHALVVDPNREGPQRSRGLSSATQIGRRLGVEIDTADVARGCAALARTG